ncbi:MAG: ABC transporter substrate-binding protein, partial [Alphaproteobacteria bacterium]
AFDGEGSNSPYTSALAQAIQASGLPVERMFKQVRLSVMAQTDEQQVPWEASSLTGDFYFTPGTGDGTEAAAVAAPPAIATVADRVAIEVAFWQSIENSQDPADFEAYLENYGRTGAFTVLARNRIRALAEQEAPGSAAVGQPPKSEEALVAEALIKARQMVVELKENAESLMESQDIPLGERLEKFRGMLGVVVDFEPMARFVLGRHKDTVTPEQWEDFFLLYRELFLTGYSFSGAKSWAGKYEVKFIRAYGPDTLVTVEFTDERGKIVEVQFRLRRQLESFFGFKIVDAMTKGVSLLVTQRDEYSPVLEREGVEGLIRALEEIVGKVEKPIEIPG